MQSISYYTSPLGEMLLAADDLGLTGLWFAGQKYYARTLQQDCREQETSVILQTKKWLDIYFSGQMPDFLPPVHMTGTPFQEAVWEILLSIPYGKTLTYGDIAKQLAEKQGLSRMSSQAVGGAVGRNPVSVIVPCHRCVGARGRLTGYAGGLERKTALLQLEGNL